jgi:hypothetical protein
MCSQSTQAWPRLYVRNGPSTEGLRTVTPSLPNNHMCPTERMGRAGTRDARVNRPARVDLL